MAHIFYFFPDFVDFRISLEAFLFIIFVLRQKKKESVLKIATNVVDALYVAWYAIWAFVLGVMGNQ